MTTPMGMSAAQLADLLNQYGKRISQLERNTRASQGPTTIENGALIINDGAGNQQLTLGLQGDGSYTMVSTTSAIPLAPDTPLVGTGVLSIWVNWNGLMADGSSPLSDFANCQVHCSATPNFTPGPTTLQGVITGTGLFGIGNLLGDTTYYVCLIAVNEAGNTGPQSGYASTTSSSVPTSIPAGSISPLQLQTGSITAAQIAAAAGILGSQIAQNTIGDGNIIEGSITAASIASNTITVAQIAAGIVIAGIVDGTTIEGAQFIAYGTTGEVLVYSGNPAPGNLIGSWSAMQGADGSGNTYPAGLMVGTPNGSQIQLNPNVNQPFDLTTSIAGTMLAMLQSYTPDVNQMMPMMVGSLVMGTGTTAKMAGAVHSPFGTIGSALVLQAQNDAGTDQPWIILGTVSMPDGMTMVVTPILAVTSFAMLLYSGNSGQVTQTKTSGSGNFSIPVGVTTAKAEAIAGGGGGGSGGGQAGGAGGGGGGYSQEPALAVPSGGTVAYSVGGGGAAGTGGGNGGNGGTTTISGSSVTVTANGGSGGQGGGSNDPAGAGAGGAGSGNTISNSGGNGGAGINTHNDYGQRSPGFNNAGGGGSSAGPLGSNSGSIGLIGNGGAGGVAPQGGGAGGNANASNQSGNSGSYPGGGGGGGGGNTPADPENFAGGAGHGGYARLTYTTGAPAILLSIASASGTDQFGTAYPIGVNTALDITTTGTLKLGNQGGTPSSASGVARLFSDVGGNPAVITPSGLSGNLPPVQTDISTQTVTATSFTALSTAWPIPANDAQPGTCYRFTFFGNGTMGTAAELLYWELQVFGKSVCNITMGATFMAASANFGWGLTAIVEVLTTGSSGTMKTAMWGAISVFTSSSSGTLLSGGSNSSAATAGVVGQNGSNTIATNAATTATLVSQWGASGCSITSFGSVMERLGP